MQYPRIYHKKTRKWAKFLAYAWALLIFLSCLWPSDQLPEVQVSFLDKWVHILIFAVWTVLVLSVRYSWSLIQIGLCWILLAGTGFLVEKLQGWLPGLGRTEEMMDVWANCAGVVLGTVVYFGIRRVFLRQA